MAGSTDLNLLRAEAHSPSYFSLLRGTSGLQGAPVDFCIPCNPYFPTPEVFELLGRNITTILKYYPSDADTIAAELCSVLGLKPQTVVMGNGSTELITWIDHLLVHESLAIPIPTFGRWTDQPMETGKRVDMYPLPEDQGFALDIEAYVRFIRRRGSRVAVICNPNNPDGGYVSRAQVIELLDTLSDLDLVVVDESFIDFVDAEAHTSVADEAVIRPNVIVLKSLGKNFGLHGIRFGYLVANPALAAKVRRMLPKWNLNSFAESVVFMLKEHMREYQDSLRLLAADRRSMFQQLSTLPGVTVYPSQGNFLMVRLPEGKDGKALRDHLFSAHNVFVRECGNKLGSSSRFLRLVVRPRVDVERLIDGMHSYLFSVGNGRATAAIGAAPSRPAQASQSAPSRYEPPASSAPSRYESPSSYDSSPYAASPSYTSPSPYAANSSRGESYATPASPSAKEPVAYLTEPSTITPPSYQNGASYQRDSYQRDPSAGSASYQRRDGYSGSSSYEPDPFVVGSDDPRHGRLDPLDTTARWTFDENTAPFNAVSDRTRRYDGRRS
ncbi:pyridoxal phosphate-dependent aminotransferase [Sphaerisporangium perillae]|uniref:pyridoxal phosphate-dependent aminotransferase n=1 Tax=Sphaerisporangium perillae TaxID=2935860 RepID=UPI00200C0661|nr:histidinol-phosphate transaminase [Sphaerisporangium perillae]